MTRPARILGFCIVLLGAGSLCAQEQTKPAFLRYTPESHAFYCDIPSAGWQAFEEEDSGGLAVHLLGPDNPAGTYRTGIDIRFVDKAQPGFVPYKKALSDLRRSESLAQRDATAVRALRVSGTMARTIEVTEKRLLPQDQLPSSEEGIHHYVVIIPSGESYYIIRLSSSLDVYLDYKDFFLKFLSSFKLLGYK